MAEDSYHSELPTLEKTVKIFPEATNDTEDKQEINVVTKKSKLIIITDEMGKGCSELLNVQSKSKYSVMGHVNSGMPYYMIGNTSPKIASSLGKEDSVIILGGLHYKYLNRPETLHATKTAIENNLRRTLEASQQTNTIIISIPYRLDNNNYNYEIYDINKAMYHITTEYKHASFIWATDLLEETDYKSTGNVINNAGKQKNCKLIVDAFDGSVETRGPKEKNDTNPQPFRGYF